MHDFDFCGSDSIAVAVNWAGDWLAADWSRETRPRGKTERKDREERECSAKRPPKGVRFARLRNYSQRLRAGLTCATPPAFVQGYTSRGNNAAVVEARADSCLPAGGRSQQRPHEGKCGRARESGNVKALDQQAR